MADYLTTALSGLGTTTNETPWGTAGQVLLEQSPRLVNTTKFDSGNLATAFGAALLGGLIKYKGRQDAAEQSAEATALAQQIQGAKTPEEQLALAQSAESSNVRNKLTNLVNALQIQKTANEQELAQKRAGSLLEIEAQLSPLGRELMQLKEKQRLREINAMTDSDKEPKTWWDELSKPQQQKFNFARAQVNELRSLAQQFKNLDNTAAGLQIKAIEPGSPQDLALSKMKTLVPSTARLLGEVGNLAQEEQQRLIDATLGSKLSGSESISKRLNQLADTADNVIQTQTKAYQDIAKFGPDVVFTNKITPVETEAQRRNRELKAELAAIKAQIAGSR